HRPPAPPRPGPRRRRRTLPPPGDRPTDRWAGQAARRAMRDLGTGLALVLVIEGVLYALFPDGMKKVAARTMLVPPQALRAAGLMVAALGVVIVWLLRR